MTIPCILILQLLNNQDRGLFDETEQSGLVYKHLRRAYNLGQLAASSAQEYYSQIEKELLCIQIDSKERTKILDCQFDNVDMVIHKIKFIACQLSRYKPTEWNRFLDVALV